MEKKSYSEIVDDLVKTLVENEDIKNENKALKFKIKQLEKEIYCVKESLGINNYNLLKKSNNIEESIEFIRQI